MKGFGKSESAHIPVLTDVVEEAALSQRQRKIPTLTDVVEMGDSKRMRGIEQQNDIETILVPEPEIGIKVPDFEDTQPLERVTETEPLPVSSDAKRMEELRLEIAARTKAEEGIEIPETTEERFDAEFGITREDLLSIAGYERLSLPQQKLLYENLVQSTYGRVKEEAAKQYGAENSAHEERAVERYGKFLGKAWSGFRSVLSKDFGVITKQQEVLAKYQEYGFEVHKEVLTQLVESITKFGPRVHEDEETGELLIDFVNVREWGKGIDRKAQKMAVENLNIAAHRFAKIPASWKEDTLGVDTKNGKEWKITSFLKEKFSAQRKQHLEYKKAEEELDAARFELTQVLSVGGIPEKDIAQMLVGMDTRIQQTQFLQTNPDAAEELSGIEDKNVWHEAAKSMFTKSGVGYVALGYVGRTALAGVLGWFAAPAVASGIAATRSWNKSAADLRERDRNARMGMTDTTNEALNVVSVTGEHGLIKKTSKLIDSFHVLERQIAFGEMNAENVDYLHLKRAEVLKSLKARTEYIYDKQKLNRVSYGTRDEFIGNQTKLYELLGEATAIVVDNEVKTDERLENRLNRYLTYKDSAIDARRRTYRKKELTKQALKAGGFALAGAFLADYFRGGAVDKAHEISAGGHATSTMEAGEVAQASPAVAETPITPEIPRVHTIVAGETLTSIMKNEIPALSALSGTYAQENAIANILQTLSPEDLERIGVHGGKVDIIRVGGKINMAELNTIIEAKRDIIESAERRFGRGQS